MARRWFHERGAKENFEFALLPLKDSRISYLEIGVFEGESLAWVAANVLTRPLSFGIGVDPYTAMHRHTQEVADERYERVVGRFKDNDNIVIFRDYSSRWLRRQKQPHAYDVIYHDGEHYAHCVLEDSVLLWPLLRPGGLLIWDDYGLSKHKNKGTAVGVEAFLSTYKEGEHFERLDLPNDYQAGVRKLEEGPSSELYDSETRRWGTVL